MCEIDQKLYSIVAGRKRAVLQSIQEETATNIYYPSPLQDLVGPDQGAGATAARNNIIIWITGEFFGVQRARDMLSQIPISKVRFVTSEIFFRFFSDTNLQSKSILSRDAAILPRKLDWMVTERTEELKTIMSDNATFIQLPLLGSSTSLITVYGDDRVNIQRTIRSIMQLVSSSTVSTIC